MRAEIPLDAADPYEWVAHNAPSLQVFSEERSDEMIQQRMEMLHYQADVRRTRKQAKKYP